MFHVKNHKQDYIFDPWGHLVPKRCKLLDKSWSGLFQKGILPDLPVTPYDLITMIGMDGSQKNSIL